MATVTSKPRRLSKAPPAALDLYRMTVNEYERLAKVAVLDDDRVELIDGYLVKKMPKKPPHIWAVAAALKSLEAAAPGWWCRKEDPVRIPSFDEPEPDVAVVRGSRDDYRGRIPGPKDVALLVEVADTSLERDRGPKRLAYARGRIPVYWIINLIERQVEVYSAPGPRGYRSSEVYRPGQDVPVVIAGKPAGWVAVNAVLP